MNDNDLKSAAYGRGLGLAACNVYSQEELDAAVAEAQRNMRERCAAVCDNLAEGARDNSAPGAPYWDEAAGEIRKLEPL